MRLEAKILDLNILLFKLFSGKKEQWLALDKNFEQNLFFLMEEKLPYLLANLYQRIKPIPFIGFSIQQRNAVFSFLLAKKIRKKFPAKKIIFGGPQTLLLKNKDKLNPDYFWVIGEGELPLYKIVSNAGKSIYLFEEIDDLDSLPMLDFGPRAPTAYSSYLPILSSRGCIHKCNFCSERRLYQKLRYHSAAYMFDQIKYLKNKYKITNFIFADSMINYNNERLEQFCNLLITKKLRINWEAQIRIAKNFPAALVKLIKESGCYNLFVGLESGSAKILKMMNKGFIPEQAIDFFSKLQRQKLHFEVSLILGYPGETPQDFRQTVQFILENKKIIPKIAQINPFVDYWGNFTDTYPAPPAQERVNTLQKILRQEKIRYTKSYINNLIYT